ncbi:energy transducer TonB [Chitinilyticum piscinae]|uniref:Energy transducer TonB n=1 Tax=Chitinilyticum piscinae TaxID=2866724 RepID=A0A8J7KFK3_9NEIS|nr:energy transducer TonB [Chitinilyticum piscinae]MBE9610059.1 energy transducer TonB [Chitinilyticum piscinae]
MILNNRTSLPANAGCLLLIAGLHAAALYALTHLRLAPQSLPPQPIVPMLLAMGQEAPRPPAPLPLPAVKPVVKPQLKAREASIQPRQPAAMAREAVNQNSLASLTVQRAEAPVAEAARPLTDRAPAAPAAAGDARPVAERVAPSFHANYLNNPRPPYPPASLSLGEEGVVMLRVEVSAQGDAASVELARSSGFPRLDAVAQATVRRWRFVPARVGDEAVPGTVLVPVNFSIKKA